MIKEYLEVGKVVGTHGVRGGLRMQPWSDDSSFLEKAKFVYTGDKVAVKIISAKAHGNVTLLFLEGIDSIEKAETLRNKILLVKRSEMSIPQGRYFIDEIIGSKVFDADSNELLGTLSDVSQTGANDVWHIKKEEKEYLVPAIESVIENVDVEKEVITIRPMGGIFDED